jgi:hypothetical protein
MYGVLLRKLVHAGERATRIQEVETPGAGISLKIDDSLLLYARYAIRSRTAERKRKTVWPFSLTEEDLGHLAELRQEGDSCVALICGVSEVETESLKHMQIALLYPEELDACVDVDSGLCQTLNVELSPGSCLRVYGPLNRTDAEKVVIPRKRADEWAAPAC